WGRRAGEGNRAAGTGDSICLGSPSKAATDARSAGDFGVRGCRGSLVCAVLREKWGGVCPRVLHRTARGPLSNAGSSAQTAVLVFRADVAGNAVSMDSGAGSSIPA